MAQGRPRYWQRANRKHKRDVEGAKAPDANEEYLLYQTLARHMAACEPLIAATSTKSYVGSHPGVHDEGHQGGQGQQQLDPAKRTLGRGRPRFRGSHPSPGPPQHLPRPPSSPSPAAVAQLGAINSLSQTVLKCTAPGVPDIYQGTELWDFSLVDPDNRRPVDYPARRAQLDHLKSAPPPSDLLHSWETGAIKLFITRALLGCRRDAPNLFLSGDYTPLEITGEKAECCIAFTREWEGQFLLVIAPRLTARVGFPPVGEAWGNTAVNFKSPPPAPLRNIFTGREVQPGALPLSSALAELPVAVLTSFSTPPSPRSTTY